MPTTARNWENIKKLEKAAKKLGWKLDVEHDRIVARPVNGLPKLMWDNKNEKENYVGFDTLEDADLWLSGWRAFQVGMEKIEFDTKEYAERKTLLAPIKAIQEIK